MSHRTYIPQLRFVAKTMCRYIMRYEAQIRAVLSDENEVFLDAALAACMALGTALDGLIEVGD